MSTSDSKLQKVIKNMKKIGMPFVKVDRIIRGFSGADKLRGQYAEMISTVKPPTDPTPPSSPANTTPRGPVKLTLNDDLSNWNGKKNSRVRTTKRGIDVTLPKRGYASKGGVNIKFIPDGLKPSSSVSLKYDLFLPSDFDFVKGGKIGLGFNINEGTGGKSWRTNDGSFRVMWRGSRGQCVPYLYLPTDQGKYVPDNPSCPLLKNQGKQFMDAISNKAPSAGLDLFRYTPKKVYLKRGQWNRICMSARINDTGKNNGTIALSVNGQTVSVDDMMWTANPDKNRFSQLQLACWFGGGDASWSATKDETISLRNVTYTYDV